MKQECPHPHRVTVLTLDLSKPYECFEKAKDLNLKELDYLYNNGGVSQLSLFTETDFDTVEQIINTNTLGQIFLIKALLPALKESRGKIVNICAIAGKMGMTMRSIVSASKSALAGFSNALRAEVKPYGVSVFTMYPDHVKTNIAKNACSGVFGRQVGINEKSIENGKGLPLICDRIIRAVAYEETEYYLWSSMYQLLAGRLAPLSNMIESKVGELDYKSQLQNVAQVQARALR